MYRVAGRRLRKWRFPQGYNARWYASILRFDHGSEDAVLCLSVVCAFRHPASLLLLKGMEGSEQ